MGKDVVLSSFSLFDGCKMLGLFDYCSYWAHAMEIDIVTSCSGFMTMRGMAAQAGFNMSYRPSRLGIPAFQGLDKKRTLENEYMTR